MSAERLQDRAARATAGYSPGDERPLKPYAVLASVFFTGFGASLLAIRAAGKELPERISAGDVVLLGLTTHKLSRLLAKDKVTSFIRAPFTRFQESTGQGEVSEEPRGEGMQLAIGELLVCPYCLAQWVAGTLVLSHIAAPRLTRMITSIYAAETMSDFLQLAYLYSKEHAS
jgi:Protein of unknown function (DUF1360)